MKELERRVSERTQALERANRELEAFSYSVSHDLRAPLRAIDGFSHLLEHDHFDKLNDDGRGLVSRIRKNTRHMGRLIDGLLRLAKLGRQATKAVDVQTRALVDAVVEELRTAEPLRSLDFRIGELPDVICDPTLIRQVWTNLLGNAVKYTGGRSLAIIEVEGIVEDGQVRFTVKDNGAGFDPQHAHKLFNVFQRLHKASEFEGTGVGLALVQRIVARHGGRVWAEGRLNEGATFGFALPRPDLRV